MPNVSPLAKKVAFQIVIKIISKACPSPPVGGKVGRAFYKLFVNVYEN
jgi:hypothetical protein